MSAVDQIHRAICNDDPALLRETLAQHPELKTRINDPAGPFDSPIILSARSPAMLDALLGAGANINARSNWWAGSFGLLDSASDELADYAIRKGARVDAHAAARLGLFQRLREIIDADPALVHARGGDGKTPLHCARTVEIAEFLLARGAHIDARDVDHESTPVQYLVSERPDVARFLISRGAQADLLAASALGELDLARQILHRDPQAIRMRADPAWFPMRNPRAGGTIYRWTLGFQCSPHEAAARFGHPQLLAFLWQHTPPDVRFVRACWSGDSAVVRQLLTDHPALVQRLEARDLALLAHAASNNDLAAVELMLDAGWPVQVRGQHNATPLHWAAWHGNAPMVRSLLRHGASREDAQNDFNGTPLGWARHGSENSWHREKGDYPSVMAMLENPGPL